MFDVEITNYESISHAKISIQGFTTLVGRNHIGKSSVMRAINAALTNQQGTHFIRWGCDYCEVHIKTEDLDLIWHKEEGKNYYTINGQSFEKIGREQPPAPVSQAGFRVLQIADQKINLNYSQQFHPLFLVDKRDTKTADLLTSVYGLDTLYNSIRLCNKEQRDANDQLQLRKKDLESTELDLDRFRNFDETYSKVTALKDRQKTITSKEAATANLEQARMEILRLVGVCKRLKKVSDVAVPDTTPIEVSIRENTNLKVIHQSKTSLETDLKALSRGIKAKLPPSLDPLREDIEGIKHLSSFQEQYSDLISQIKGLKKASDINIPDAEIDVDSITRLKNWKDTIQKEKTVLIDLKRTIQDTDEEIKSISEEMSSYENCPLCGKAF